MRRKLFAIRLTRSLALAGLVVLALACAGGSATPPSAPRSAGAAQPTVPAAAQAAPPVQAPASAALPAGAPTVAPLSPPVTVKLGLPNVLADVGLLVAQHRGYFGAEGLIVEFVSTPSLYVDYALQRLGPYQRPPASNPPQVPAGPRSRFYLGE